MFRKVLILYLIALATYSVYVRLSWDCNLLAEPQLWQKIYLGDSTKSAISDVAASYENVKFTIMLTGEMFENFAGMGCIFPPEIKNLSPFDEFTIKIESNAQYATVLTAHMTDNNDTIITATTMKPHGENQTFSLKDLEIPNWWKVENPKIKEVVHVPFNNSIGILIGSSKAFEDHHPEAAKYRITEFKFQRNLSWTLQKIVLFFLPTGFILLWLGLEKHRKIIKFTNSTENCSILETYIGENFPQQDLNEELISRKLNLLPGALNEFCRKRLNCGFPEYLRIIRIAEAERLITETELQIKEIAGKVGYKHVSGFNRDFKKLTGFAPGAFRK